MPAFDLDAIRARHVPDRNLFDGTKICPIDGYPWPCDTTVVLRALRRKERRSTKAALDAALEGREFALQAETACCRERDAALERERRLRAALEGLRAEVAALTAVEDEDTDDWRWISQSDTLDAIDARLADLT